MDKLRVVNIKDTRDAERYLREINADEMGVRIMIPKAVFRAVKILGVPGHVAGIIKQEMLSKGGEAAIGRQALFDSGGTEVLLMGTMRQFELLLVKLRMQPFGLKKLAARIEVVLKASNDEGQVKIDLGSGQELVMGNRTLIMGILNVTPDSFYDGGRYTEEGQALRRAEEMVQQGADIIDLGGVSTRPGAIPVSAAEEIRRVLPVLRSLKNKVPHIPISVDTFCAETARAVLQEGADIINDPGMLKADPAMASTIGEFGVPAIIMHNRLGGGYADLMAEVIDDLQNGIKLARESGIQEDQIIIDPGIGFGKTPEQNLALIKNLAELKSLGKPILLGVSNKGFIGKVNSDPTEERLSGSLAAAVVGAMNGAALVRVHNVAETRRALAVADQIRRAW